MPENPEHAHSPERPAAKKENIKETESIPVPKEYLDFREKMEELKTEAKNLTTEADSLIAAIELSEVSGADVHEEKDNLAKIEDSLADLAETALYYVNAYHANDQLDRTMSREAEFTRIDIEAQRLSIVKVLDPERYDVENASFNASFL